MDRTLYRDRPFHYIGSVTFLAHRRAADLYADHGRSGAFADAAFGLCKQGLVRPVPWLTCRCNGANYKETTKERAG